MIRKLTIVTAVAALLVIAGCVGGGGVGTDNTDSSETSVSASDFNYPTGFSEDGVETVDLAVQTHKETILNSSSYHSKSEQTYERIREKGASKHHRSTEYIVDYEELKLLTTTHAKSGTVENPTKRGVQERRRFITENKTYTFMNGSSGGVVYQTNPQKFNATKVYNSNQLNLFLNGYDYSNPTVKSNEDSTWVVYTARNLTENEDLTNSNVKIVNSAGSKLAIDDDGYIRYVSYDINMTMENGATIDVTGSIKYMDLDSTTVQKPDWLSIAKEEAE